METRMHKNHLLRKTLIVVIILVVLSENVVTLIAQDVKNKPSPFLLKNNILYVGGSGSNNYSRIIDAVNDALDGDTIFVYDDSSPYYENTIWINTSINLIGEDKNTTIIDGKGGGNSTDVIRISANKVKVTGFTIRNCSGNNFDTGIYITGPGGPGIKIRAVSNVNISKNIFIDTATGILEFKTFHTIISGNAILSGNSSDYPHHTVFAIASCLASSIITDNTIINPRAYGIVTENTHCLIEGNIISNGTQSENSWGISQRSSLNRIIGNTITNFVVGIRCDGVSTFNFFSQNNISHCTRVGISFEMLSILNVISKNSISQCDQYGIFIGKSFFTVVKENNFINNNINAFFIKSMGTRWVHNYWDDWGGTGPEIIKGYRWVNFDWRPSATPIIYIV